MYNVYVHKSTMMMMSGCNGQKLHMKRREKNLLMGIAKTIDASQLSLLAPADFE